MMKRFLTIAILLSYALMLEAQSISVSSFRLLDTDLTANTSGTSEIDQNGETAALIKIVTTETGFTFDCGMLGIVKAKQTPGEVWLYLPRGAQKVTIKHPQIGVLRNYYFPISIEGARTYEMILAIKRNQNESISLRNEKEDEIIYFYDQEAKRICLKHWDFNKDGVFSASEAEQVKTLNGAFKYNKNIINLNFLTYFTNLVKIEKEEFSSCTSLFTIKLPKSIKEIGNYAFGYCKNLYNIEIQDSIVRLGDNVFSDCRLSGSFDIGDISYSFSDNRSFIKSSGDSEIFEYGYNLNSTNCKVIKSEKTKNQLKLYFSCHSSFDYVKSIISQEAYLKANKGNKHYRISRIEQIQAIPGCKDLNSGHVLFSLTFLGVPNNWSEVDFIDPYPDGWEIYGIRI